MEGDSPEKNEEELREIARKLKSLIDVASKKLDEINRVLKKGNPGGASKSTNTNSVQQIGNKTVPSFLKNAVRKSEQMPPTKKMVKEPSPEDDFVNAEIKKVTSGIPKLDELLTGGIRTASNVLLLGPPYSEKYMLVWNFIASSLKESIPVVVITTDKDINEIKYEVKQIYQNVEEAEEKGLLNFIDAYSTSIGAECPSEYAIVLESLTNVSALLKSLDQIVRSIRSKYPYYRLIFSSLTTYATELDEKILIKFVQQYAQKRKNENGVTMNVLESALFDNRLVEAISYLMDGSIEFKNEGAKGFLRVEGLGSVRSREWIEIYPLGTSFDLGAFTLEKIR